MLQYFISRQNTVGQTIITDKRKGDKVIANVSTENRPPNENDFEKHLSGEIGLGLSPLLESGSCRWGAIDIDIYPIDIEEISKKYKDLPLHFCRTKSGGLHVYLFFKKNFKSKEVRIFLTELSWLLGFDDVEVFPKQEKTKKDKQANWINLPYFKKNETDRYCIHNGEKLSYEGFERRIKENLISDFNQVRSGFILSGAPPCLQKIWANSDFDGRCEIVIFNTAIFLKQKYPDNWIKQLYTLNYTLDDPLPDKRVESQIVAQLTNKDVFYMCSEFKNECDKKVCYTREFGVGTKHSIERMIGDLKKVTTSPPTWLMIVNDFEIQLSTEQLMNYNAVRQRSLEVTNILLPRIKLQDWDELLSEKMENLVIVDAPDDAGEHSELYHWIKEFCCTRSNATVISDITRDSVYIEDGNNYFRSAALSGFIKNKVSIKYKNNLLFMLIKKIGGDAKNKNIDGKTVRLWYIPLYDEQKDDTENRKAPDWKKDLDEGEF